MTSKMKRNSMVTIEKRRREKKVRKAGRGST